jgi:broad specificity phosphatase PhoE
VAVRLWLVRHGETESNRDGIFQGHLDIGLSAVGEEQAARVARHLSAVAFDAVYASDLRRAARTAEIVTAGRFSIILDADLREMHYGVLQGVRYHDAAEALRPHGLEDSWLSGEFQKRGHALPGGESMRTIRARSRRFLRRIDAMHPPESNGDILIVAHGGKLAILLTVLLELPGSARWSMRFINCGLTRLQRMPERTTLDFFNLNLWDPSWPFTDRATDHLPLQRVE